MNDMATPTYPIWITNCAGAPLHELVQLFDPAERPTIDAHRGRPSIIAHVRRRERFGELVHACANHRLVSVRRCTISVDTTEYRSTSRSAAAM
jgi:hypothetical protein